VGSNLFFFPFFFLFFLFFMSWAREKSIAEETPTTASRLGGVGVIP
jgi:hypothetical protein